MSRLSDTTKLKIRENILIVLGEAKRPRTTFSISKDIARSWKMALEILNNLKKEGLVKEIVISNIKAWSLK